MSKRELDLGGAGAAGDRRRRTIVRRGRDRDVPLARQHARGRVEADPARARQIDFGPGVQIGEIVLDLWRCLERIDVGAYLDEITGDEAGREAEVTEDLDQQPRGVAARSGAAGQRLLRRLHAGLHADDVTDRAFEARD